MPQELPQDPLREPVDSLEVIELMKEQVGEMSQQIAILQIMVRRRDKRIAEQDKIIEMRLEALEKTDG